MPRIKRKLIENVHIVDIGHKGFAVGKTPEGQTVFVENAVPGDVVDVITMQKKKGIFFCKPQTYQTLSDLRTDPRCRHFAYCGGCKWQHLQYSAQLGFKQRSVTEALRRIAHLPEPPVLPILGSDDPFRYRNKMEYTFTDRCWVPAEDLEAAEDFRPGLGLHVAGAFAHVTNIEECLLQDETANTIRNFVRDFAIEKGMTFQNIRQQSGQLRNLILRNNKNGEWMVTVVFGEDIPDQRDLLLNALQSTFSEVKSLYYCINTKSNDSVFDLDFIHFSGNPFLKMELGHVEYCLGPKSFFQTNSIQAERMCRVVRDMAALESDMLLYDLYCGIGSFSLYLAKQVNHVVGIEYIPEAIDDAKVNARHNHIENAVFLAGDVKEVLFKPEVTAYGQPTVILTDPPRAGMEAKVVQAILDIAPKRIVYVSCNPATQARDIALLSGKYRVERCQPIDMFPQTAHVENVALLGHR